MNIFFVYILRSKKDGYIYIGQTNNIFKRLVKHNKGQIKSTKYRIPFELIYFEK
ncbi:MAG: GIY-YIG nuclease family protein [Nitrospirota bacterium]